MKLPLSIIMSNLSTSLSVSIKDIDKLRLIYHIINNKYKNHEITSIYQLRDELKREIDFHLSNENDKQKLTDNIIIDTLAMCIQ